jgi:hypothetical protein
MRGQQLTRLISKLRAELGRSTNISVGVDDAQNLTAILQRTQEMLYEDYDWPHLRQTFPAVPLQAGQRYYDLPAGLNYDRIESAVVRLSGLPVEFKRGIEVVNYASFDSDAGDRASPAQRWDIRWVDTAEQIEVWPIPDGNDSSMQFTGIRNLRRLVDGDDVSDLDDNLIVLFAAADVLAHQESPDAQIKLTMARQHYSRLKGRSTGGRSHFRLGGGCNGPQPFRATIAISGR